MPKPPLPTQAEIRTYCRSHYGHWSNISREWLKTQTSPAERIGTYGYDKVDREMAELFEADWFTLSEADQDTFIDWYADHYRGEMYDTHEGPEKRRDPNREDPMYGLVGITVGWWSPDTCAGRKCKLKVMNETVGGSVDIWDDTMRTCPAHSASGQKLRDACKGENDRKNSMLAIIESIVSLETKEDRTTWVFTDDRIGTTDERVLTVNVEDVTNPELTNIQGAVDLQFGTGSILVGTGAILVN